MDLASQKVEEQIWTARLNYTAGAPHRSVKSAASRMKQGFLQENELAQMIRVVGR